MQGRPTEFIGILLDSKKARNMSRKKINSLSHSLSPFKRTWDFSQEINFLVLYQIVMQDAVLGGVVDRQRFTVLLSENTKNTFRKDRYNKANECIASHGYSSIKNTSFRKWR